MNTEERDERREVRSMRDAEERWCYWATTGAGCGHDETDDAGLSRLGGGARRDADGDPLWSVQAYRLSVYAIACHTFDRRSKPAIGKTPTFDQLRRSIGSIAANIAEGYSRASAKDRNCFYGYALGSTREAISWYDTLELGFGAEFAVRQSTLIQIRRLLLTMLRRTRTADERNAFREGINKSPDPET